MEDWGALLSTVKICEEETLANLVVVSKRIAAQDMVIRDLQSDLSQVQDVATWLSQQLEKALYIRDEA